MPTKKTHPYLLFFNSDIKLLSLKIENKSTTTIQVNSSIDIYNFVKSGFQYENNFKEYFYTIYLNNKNLIIGYHLISIGGITGTVVEKKHVLAGAILSNASSIILFHNHPSGNRFPSDTDKRTTNQIKECCNFHDIKLLDHLIITESNYYSFADEGLI